LYEGFERKWAHYKIYQLIMKALLTVAMLIFTRSVEQSISSLVVYSLFAGLSFYATPFIAPSDDLMDMSGRVTNMFVCAGGLVNGISSNSVLNLIVGISICIVTVINTIIEGVLFLYGFETTRKLMKNISGRFTFTDTCLNIIRSAEEMIPGWDAERECKHRIWHTFWENCLINKCGEEVSLRLMELKEATADSGFENIKQHWDGELDPKVSQSRMQCRRELEGIDVYWNDKTGTRDGRLDSHTCFGKMYVIPYPFQCIMVYDDAKDEAIIRHDKFQEFFRLNLSSEIKRKRNVRQKLRALSRRSCLIYLPFSRMETHRVKDGTKRVSYIDSDGKTKFRTETNYSSVTFKCSYVNGLISVASNTNKMMSAGFKVGMGYSDGTGSARLPNTGKIHRFTNMIAKMGPDHIGLFSTMEETSKLRQIFESRQDVLNKELQLLQQRHNAYRTSLISSLDASNSILGNGFWYFVYNNHNLPRESLEKYLELNENNLFLKSLVNDNSVALDFVYKRMNYVKLHPAITLWYTFWDDFYHQNGDITVVQSHYEDFDPRNGYSICYRYMEREDLEEWLGERGLIGARSSITFLLKCSSYLFHEGILDTLYWHLFQLSESSDEV